MTRAAKSWVVNLARIGVCAVCLVLVLRGVTWHDRVTLTDGARWTVVGRTSSSLILEQDSGERMEISRDAVERPNGDYPRIEWGLPSALKQSDLGILALALVIFLPVTPIQSLRFQWLLRAQDIRISYWQSVKLCYAGNFFNFVTPLGTTGGDVFRAYYASLHTHDKTEAVTTVFLDRVVGLVGLVALGGLATLFEWNDPVIRAVAVWCAALLACLLAGAGAFFSRRLRRLFRVDRVLDALPLSGQLKRIDRATFRLRGHKRLLAGTFVLTGLLQFFALLSFIVAAKGLCMKWQWDIVPAYFAYIAAGLVVAAIPISPMGLGTMELAFKKFFVGPYGNLSQVLFLAMAIRLIQLIWALPGCLVPLTGAHRPTPAQVSALEAAVPAGAT